MTRSCAKIREMARREAEGGLAAPEFAALDAHLETCARCALWRRRTDSLAMFTPLAADAEDAPDWGGLWEGIRDGLPGAGRMHPWEGRGLLRPVYRVALAASLVVALGLVALVGRGPGRDGPATVDPFAGVAARLAGAGPRVATVGSIDSPGARIYEMSVVREGEAMSHLVMIFDEEIDL